MTATAAPVRPPGIAPPPAAAAPRAAQRLELIDRLRGLVIALMVLDHVREYFSLETFLFEPTDLARTTPALYATRWVTHLCAPTFVFLAGASAFLQRAAAPDAAGRAAVARFLLARGLWLIALEHTLVVFGFHFGYPFFFFQVIWAIGVGMVALAALLRLPPAAVLALGVAIVAGHGLLAPVDAAEVGAFGRAWSVLMEPGPAPPPLPGFVAYPAVPWLGVMCLGYGLGPVFLRPERERRRALLALGAGMFALFVVLRAINGYGDPAPWAPQATGTLTVLSFMKVTKYPPSLLFVLATLGISLPLGVALMRLRGPVGGRLAALLLAFGRTPMFTYLLHAYLVHGLALLAGVAAGVSASAFLRFLEGPERLREAGWGVGLGAVYAIWAAVCLALYPVSRWYARVRRERPRWWMRYL